MLVTALVLLFLFGCGDLIVGPGYGESPGEEEDPFEDPCLLPQYCDDHPDLADCAFLDECIPNNGFVDDEPIPADDLCYQRVPCDAGCAHLRCEANSFCVVSQDCACQGLEPCACDLDFECRFSASCSELSYPLCEVSALECFEETPCPEPRPFSEPET